MKYIDSEKLIAEIYKMREEALSVLDIDKANNLIDIVSLIESLQQEQDMGEVSDGYHTFNELYYYRMLYNAAFFNLLPKEWVHKSKRHHTGEECFGGGWFIVMANLPTGQVSNHYELKDWDLFKVPEREIADEWDGHTPQEAAKRIYEYLQQEQPEVPSGEDVMIMCNQILIDWVKEGKTQEEKEQREQAHIRFFELYDDYLMQEQPEVDLDKEIDKEWAKCEPVDEGMGLESANIVNEQFDSIARHFYELGQRTKYQQDREEFAKLKAKEWQDGYDEGYAKGLNARREQSDVEKYDCPTIPIEESIEVISRMQYIDEELKPIAKFIMDYASWNLHKDEWNQPTIEVPLFRVLDALVQKGKPYCCAG